MARVFSANADAGNSANLNPRAAGVARAAWLLTRLRLRRQWNQIRSAYRFRGSSSPRTGTGRKAPGLLLTAFVVVAMLGNFANLSYHSLANMDKALGRVEVHKQVQRGWIGVQIQEVTPDIAKNLGLPSASGALVADVTKDGPAEKAGFKQGDVILSYNGHDIAKVRDLPIAVAQTPVGDKAEVKVWRKGSPITLQPVIAAMPSDQKLAKAEAPAQGGGNGQVQAARAMGLKLAPLTPDLRRQAGVPAGVKGVIVTDVADDSPLADIGVEPGDVIVDINQQPVTTPQDAAAKLDAVSKQKGNKSLLLLINRRGINQYVALSFSGNDNG